MRCNDIGVSPVLPTADVSGGTIRLSDMDIRKVDCPVNGSVSLVRSPGSINPGGKWLPALVRIVGEHTSEILSNLGLGEEEIAALHHANVI